SSLKEEFVEPFEYIKKHGKDLDSATYKESKEFGHQLTKAIFTIGAVLTAGVGSAALLAKLGTKLGGTLKDIADIGSEKVLDDIGKSMGNFKKLFSQSADEVNKSLKALGYTEAPYKPSSVVDTIELTEQTQFVRVYDGISSMQAGGWVMKAEDIAGLTPQQIQNKFALPSTPKYVTDVVFESGTKLRTGTANGIFGFDGGGTQFDLMGQYIGDFVNPRLLP
ncbi:hypothetical protein ACFSCX_16235, partial [Bacillus salitolerans]